MLYPGEWLKYEKNPQLEQAPTGRYHHNEGLKVRYVYEVTKELGEGGFAACYEIVQQTGPENSCVCAEYFPMLEGRCMCGGRGRYAVKVFNKSLRRDTSHTILPWQDYVT